MPWAQTLERSLVMPRIACGHQCSFSPSRNFKSHVENMWSSIFLRPPQSYPSEDPTVLKTSHRH